VLREASSYNALAVSIKRGRLVATLSVTLNEPEQVGSLPAGVAVGHNDVAIVSNSNRSLRIVTAAQNVMEETSRKTKKRLERRLAARKADGQETRSVRRALKRLSRRRHTRTRLFCHVAAGRIIEWAGDGAILALEDLRKLPPSRRRKTSRRGPHFYETLRRRIEEKAQAVAMPVFYVNTTGDALRCAVCGAAGTIDNHTFTCGSCINTTHASRNAALNVKNKFTVTRPWAAVNQP
jgi:putative transposase